MLPARHSAPLVLVLAALACGEETIPPAAKLLAVTPQRGSSLAPVAIAISGGGLNPRVITAFGKSSSRIDATFTARLSDVALEEVTLGKDHVLHAVVPAGLAPISHDLFVTDPWGREVKLSKAYRAEAGPTVASRLAFPTPPPPLRAGICSERLFVEREDPGGAPTAGPAEVPVSLVAAGLRLYSDLGCAAEISTVTIAANQTVASFHLLTNASGSFTLSATGQGLEPASATVTAQIDPAVDQIAISGPRLALTGKCSGPLLLVREDASGAEVARSSTANVRVDVRPPAGLQLFADRSCTVAATGAAITTGLTTARLWFSGVTARSVALEGRAPNHRFNTHLVTLGDEADVAVLAFTTATQRVKAGSCSSPVTIEVRDSNGNPAPLAAGASLDLSTVPAGGALFFSDAACQSAITSLAIPPGMASGTFHFKPAAAGQLDLTVTGVGLAATQSETVTP